MEVSGTLPCLLLRHIRRISHQSVVLVSSSQAHWEFTHPKSYHHCHGMCALHPGPLCVSLLPHFVCSRVHASWLPSTIPSISRKLQTIQVGLPNLVFLLQLLRGDFKGDWS